MQRDFENAPDAAPSRDAIHEAGGDAVPVRLVILFVGGMGLLALVIAAWLLYEGKEATQMTTLTTGCLTGLLALLAQTRTGGRAEDGSRSQHSGGDSSEKGDC